MKKLILFAVVFFTPFLTYSQNIVEALSLGKVISEKTDSIKTVNIESFDPTYFVLGTLSDYMGRFAYVNRTMQVDRYYPYEKPLVDYLTDYIKTELDIEVNTIFEETNHSKMFSEELSKTLNSFYGEKDKLIDSKFETDEQINSFLAGVYYRFGQKLDTSIYKIQLANSPKHQKCYELLKQIHCHKIFYKYLRNIPAQFILYFEPTNELRGYLDAIEPYRMVIEESRIDQILKILDITKEEVEELEKNFNRTKDDEIKAIKNAFDY